MDDAKRLPSMLGELVLPLAFIIAGSWVTWNGPAYIMAFGLGSNFDALAARYDQINALDWIALIALPILFVLGVAKVERASVEYDDMSLCDRTSLFIGRVTMLLIVALVLVMFFEVVMRYVVEKPTLWATELSLWVAGFIFLFSGLYAMQQRSHIRIFLLYDLLPRGLQKACDTFSTFLILVFSVALIYGAWGEASQKFLRWETFGTAFDPPIPATLKPLVIIFMVLVSIQALSNLIRDWNREPEYHSPDEIDEEEIAVLKRILGDTDNV
jgi:TRAP-type mannitol/chloroaromatic compound transport system permease small subunit